MPHSPPYIDLAGTLAGARTPTGAARIPARNRPTANGGNEESQEAHMNHTDAEVITIAA
jgi:hypothetical protein